MTKMKIELSEAELNVEMTKISPKGQVVIPQKIREQMSIMPGSHFAVYGKGDTIVFKILNIPTPNEMDNIIRVIEE